MTSERLRRVASVLSKEVSEHLLKKSDDYKTGAFFSISHVEVCPDLSQAKVMITFYEDAVSGKIIRNLNNHRKEITKQVSKRLRLKRMPLLIFMKDDFIEKSLEMDKKIQNLVHSD